MRLLTSLMKFSRVFSPSTTARSVLSPSTAARSVLSLSTAARSVLSPSTAARSVFSPPTAARSVFSPSTAARFVFSPSTAARSVFSPSTAARSVFSPSTAAHSVFSPSTAARSSVPTSVSSVICPYFSIHTATNLGSREVAVNATTYLYGNSIDVPTRIDWREKNVLNPVRDQIIEGPCWAFAVTANVEAVKCIVTGNAVPPLSVQELLDCDPFNMGPVPGYMRKAFYFIQSVGLTTEENYPFKGSESGQPCQTCKVLMEPRVTITGFEMVPHRNEEAILKAVAHHPVCASIDTRGVQKYLYDDIIRTPFIQNGLELPLQLNHAVVIVGYDKNELGEKYWIVRNSWGDSWGGPKGNGHFKILRGINLRGIEEEVTFPIV